MTDYDKENKTFKLFVPENYKSQQSVRETEIAIKIIKDHFEREISDTLNLTRVSAPLFVDPCTGLNDNLNGVERAVVFDIKDMGCNVEIVHSLAKWKRMALGQYGFGPGEGIYTDMNAIRRDETLDNLHSVYVDQWDWELVITSSKRTQNYLKRIVKDIYSCFYRTQNHILRYYPFLEKKLPHDIYFISSQELEDMYPDLSAAQREDKICKEKKAVFVMQIGGKLKSGMKHDGRAPDYDDWNLNGDMLFWYPLLDRAIEVSSMGIRVDSNSMQHQLELSGCTDRMEMPFHKKVISEKLPLTAGGGIGQSRICMFFLDKAHIGEVQSSIWPEEMIGYCREKNISLL